MRVDVSHARAGCLFAALLLYGLLSSPTPDHPDWVEAVTGLLLVAAVGPAHGASCFLPSGRLGPVWQGAGKALLIYGSTVPLIVALAEGNEAPRILRDYLAFLFLLLPLFLAPLAARDERYKIALTGLAVFIGLAFSLRALIPAHGWPDPLGIGTHENFLYLTNAPTVLFAALLLSGLGLEALSGKRIGPSAALFLLALLPLTAMAAVLQRASLGLFAASMAFLLAVMFYRQPLKAVLPLAILCLAVWAAQPLIAETASGLLAKTKAVGLNMRADEAAAVLDRLDTGILSVVFGKGWGASFVSPAVGPASVNFTHSLLTSLWLKTGLAGLALGCLYLGALAGELLRLLVRRPLFALALAAPFFIDVFLYASYKSLDFGLILLMIAVYAPAPRRLKESRGYCIENG